VYKDDEDSSLNLSHRLEDTASKMNRSTSHKTKYYPMKKSKDEEDDSDVENFDSDNSIELIKDSPVDERIASPPRKIMLR
jgi:hypothetical protein